MLSPLMTSVNTSTWGPSNPYMFHSDARFVAKSIKGRKVPTGHYSYLLGELHVEVFLGCLSEAKNSKRRIFCPVQYTQDTCTGGEVER